MKIIIPKDLRNIFLSTMQMRGEGKLTISQTCPTCGKWVSLMVRSEKK